VSHGFAAAQNGRCLTIPWAVDHSPRYWKHGFPANLAGEAIAETLFGDNNVPAPSHGFIFPERGHCRVTTIHFPSTKKATMLKGNNEPLFSLGWGLSYTTFKYDRQTVKAPAARKCRGWLCCNLTNTGSAKATIVAQLYVAARQDRESWRLPGGVEGVQPVTETGEGQHDCVS